MSRPRMRGRVGTVLADKWRIEKALATGGMASVYAAVNVKTAFRVAIKVLSDDASRDEGARKRFVREGYLANGVKHDGIVKVIDDGVTEDGALFLIMELLEGQTLEELREASGGKVAFERAIEIVEAAADVLAAAHDANLVHRDVKPENIFLTKDGVVKLLDFGIAGKSQVSEDATRTGAGYGTPMYMAPEQITGDQRIDVRVDVFALGATLYRIVSGRYPHDAADVVSYLNASLVRKPKPLHELEPSVPRAVSAVVTKAMSARAAERYADARAFSSALDEALDPMADETTDRDAHVKFGTAEMSTDAMVMRTEVMEPEHAPGAPETQPPRTAPTPARQATPGVAPTHAMPPADVTYAMPAPPVSPAMSPAPDAQGRFTTTEPMDGRAGAMPPTVPMWPHPQAPPAYGAQQAQYGAHGAQGAPLPTTPHSGIMSASGLRASFPDTTPLPDPRLSYRPPGAPLPAPPTPVREVDPKVLAGMIAFVVTLVLVLALVLFLRLHG